jgi:hypothetical protein
MERRIGFLVSWGDGRKQPSGMSCVRGELFVKILEIVGGFSRLIALLKMKTLSD